jgi:hypothetical protein
VTVVFSITEALTTGIGESTSDCSVSRCAKRVPWPSSSSRSSLRSRSSSVLAATSHRSIGWSWRWWTCSALWLGVPYVTSSVLFAVTRTAG